MSNRRRPFTFIRLLKLIVMAFVLAFIAKIFVAEAFKIPSGSMEDTLLAGDFVIVDKIPYGPSTPEYLPFSNIEIPSFSLPKFGAIERNNIYVFRYPGDQGEVFPAEDKNYIKRCVGLPGDTLRILARKLYVNSVQLEPPETAKFLRDKSKFFGTANKLIFPSGAEWNEDNYGPIRIPYKGEEIKLNRNNINRWRDLINRENGADVVSVLGMEVRINNIPAETYTVKNNYYFFMGDNRDESFDSRFWGFVPEQNIIGRPWIIYWSIKNKIGNVSFWDRLRWNRLGTLIK